ncbi:MAG: outer membrane beta-barrel protein [Thiotrichaceae bacterium]|nr:outer membrane beta-barrel protein [Thiotrichaceae bacterium]PCI14108.1 MAG: hypothetical protein COB71_03950 [Thiotrichales bacterium]
MSALRPGRFLITLFILMAGMNSAVANDANNYSGLQYFAVDSNSTNQEGEQGFKTSAVVGRMGSFINNYLALEARVGFGLSDDKVTISGFDAALEHAIINQYGIEIENIFGFYLLGNMPVSNYLNVYGLVGVSSVGVGTTFDQSKIHLASGSEVGSLNETDNLTKNGLSYGLGTSFKFAGKASLNLEYMNYLDKSDFGLNTFSVGILFNF